MKILLPCFVVAVILGSCDIITEPVQSPTVPIDTTTSVKQNVLIEDYTGHTCGNCPEAADIAHQLQKVYGSDRVIVVAVHSGPFAVPRPPDYPADWRSEVGEQLDQTFRISRAGNPNGLVNRITYNGKFIQSKDNWAPATVELMARKPKLDIVATSTYSPATRKVDVAVELNYLESGTSDYNLCAWIIENGLKGDQTDYRVSPSHIHDFAFDHVLRTALNGTWGDQISETDVPAGSKRTRSLTYTIPSDKDWNVANCELVVFVHRYNTTKEIVQAVKVKLAP